MLHFSSHQRTPTAGVSPPGNRHRNQRVFTMKQALTRTALKLYHFVNDECVLGLHANLSGVVGSDLYGDVTGLRGDVTGLYGVFGPSLRGDVSPDLRGDVSGLRGDVSGLRGNIDDCDLSDNDRKAGVDVASLVAQ